MIRYKTLDQCFRNTGRRYYIEDLMEECTRVLQDIYPDINNVSRRTILNDIAFMEGDGWGDKGLELLREKDGRRVYYRYADPNFSIESSPLTSEEIEHIKLTIQTLSRFKGLPQFDWVDDILTKLSIATYNRADYIVDFGHNPYLQGLEYIGKLYDAIINKQILKLAYKPYESELMSFVIHPYFLKHYNGRWFLIGYNPTLQRNDWVVALDRVKGISVVGGEYQENQEIDFEDYFEDIIGVTHTSFETESVVLHFNARSGHYVETKPLHGTQRGRWISRDCYEVTIDVALNYELESLIMSYGDSVMVVQPQQLRQSIIQRCQAMLHLYDDISREQCK